MSLKNCSIPGCILGSYMNNKKLRMKGIKMSVFSLPTDPVLKKKWMKILQKRKIRITANFSVCELHFKQEDISIYSYAKTSDRIVYGRNIRKVVKFGSVPSMFEDISLTAVKLKQTKGGWEETLEKIFCKKTRKIADNVKSTDISATKNDDCLMHGKLVKELNLIKKHLVKENTDISSMEDSFTYSKLLRELHLIKKPNKWWGTIHMSDCVTFFRSKNCSFEKVVIIDTDMDVKIYVDGIKLNITHLMGFTCMNDISSLLKGLEWFKLDIKEN